MTRRTTRIVAFAAGAAIFLGAFALGGPTPASHADPDVARATATPYPTYGPRMTPTVVYDEGWWRVTTWGNGDIEYESNIYQAPTPLPNGTQSCALDLHKLDFATRSLASWSCHETISGTVVDTGTLYLWEAANPNQPIPLTPTALPATVTPTPGP